MGHCASAPTWLSVFLDLPAGDHDAGLTFWRDVSGYAVSEPRGDHDEFVTLLPPEGDDTLRVQRLVEGEARIHLDLHVDDPRACADAALALGAVELADRGYVVVRSPGGQVVCFVGHPRSAVPSSMTWPGGHRSSVDQVCLDLPATAYDDEVAFWSGIVERPIGGESHEEFARFLPEPPWGMRVLVQRLGESDGPARAHLDLASTDRSAETARHRALGAAVVEVCDDWTVMADPTGRIYCITDRLPRDVESA